MLNKEHSTNSRSYADFRIETLLKNDYSKDRGTVRQSTHNNGKKVDSDWETNSDQANFSDAYGTVSGKVDGKLKLSTENSTSFVNGMSNGDNSKEDNFSWLSCTRFKPPKLTRARRKVSSSKRNGRGPRIPFSTHQLAVLERTFISSQYLSSKAISSLAESLQLTEVRVKIWFQNRRARCRRESEGTLPTPTTSVSSEHFQSALPSSSFYNYVGCRNNRLISSNSTFSSSTSVLSKQSFRHLINDLNLMTANVSTNLPKPARSIDPCFNFTTSSATFPTQPTSL